MNKKVNNNSSRANARATLLVRVIQPRSIKNSLPMGVMMLPESSFAFFAPVFMNKYHRVHAQCSRWE
jgi:hypothetical protein